MNQQRARAIILSRTDFGEADRIITVLTPEFGKLRLMARGARKVTSKLAGGIELFSISDITFIRGRGDIGTLVSARLDRHYGTIVTQLDRVQAGYDSIKRLNKATEDELEGDYFLLLEQIFVSLNDVTIPLLLINAWFQAQLLKLGGHAPNLKTDNTGQPLEAEARYGFDFDHMAFIKRSDGRYGAAHIKVIRLLFSDSDPVSLNKINELVSQLSAIGPLIQTMLNTFIRV